MQEENRSTRRKTCIEASLDWKPNGHTVPGPGIEPRFSGPQRPESPAMLPASPKERKKLC